MNDLSERIRHYRKRKGLTMESVAKSLSIRTDNYAKYESGTRKPREDRLIALSKILGVSRDALCEGVEREFAFLLARHAVDAVLGRVESFRVFVSDMESSSEAYAAVADFFAHGACRFAEEAHDCFREYMNCPNLRALIELHDAYRSHGDKREGSPTPAAELSAEISCATGSYNLETTAKLAFCAAMHRYLNDNGVNEILNEAEEMSEGLDALQFFAVKAFVPYLSLIMDAVKLCSNTGMVDFGNAFLFGASTPGERNKNNEEGAEITRDAFVKPYETDEIREKLNVVKEAVLRAVPNTEAIYLFGSYANGTPHKDSDFDICVVVPDNAENPIDTEVRISSLLYSGSFRIPVDLIVKHSDKFHRNKQYATLEKIVANTGVKIYG